jgi:predicted PurR-regulated permease PerM
MPAPAMITTDPFPFYIKLCLNLITIYILASILYLGQGILVPFFFSVLLSTLLLPVTNLLQRWKLPKVLAILVAIFISLAALAGIIYFLSTQISIFLADIDTIKQRLADLLTEFQNWINRTFKISEYRQNKYLEDTAQNLRETGPGFLGKTVGTITESLSYLVFLPVYTFLILYYKDLIKKFFIAVFKNADPNQVGDVLYQARTIGRDYIVGLLIDMTIVFILNSIGFLILGIKYPIFLALVAAILNLIPYIGMLIANVFTIMITIVSSDNISDAFWAALVLAVVQVIDNNFLIPMIVGNKVRINALVTIIGVVVGGTLCGIGGMFLAIPAVATLKVIFDHVSDLKPWGMILGDDVKKEEDKKTEPIV